MQWLSTLFILKFRLTQTLLLLLGISAGFVQGFVDFGPLIFPVKRKQKRVIQTATILKE